MVEWSGNAARVEEIRNSNTIFAGKLEDTLGRPTRRQENGPYKQMVTVSTGFIWVRMRTCWGCCGHGNELSYSIQRIIQKIISLAERLLASQRGTTLHGVM
jgi:hypothetical protein